jgi:hypothetical protein
MLLEQPLVLEHALFLEPGYSAAGDGTFAVGSGDAEKFKRRAGLMRDPSLKSSMRASPGV